MTTVRRTPVDPFSGRPIGPPRDRPSNRPLVLPGQPNGRADVTPMPDGSDIRALLDWVGYDPQRAKAAIAAEHDRDPVRTEVLDHLGRPSQEPSV